MFRGRPGCYVRPSSAPSERRNSAQNTQAVFTRVDAPCDAALALRIGINRRPVGRLDNLKAAAALRIGNRFLDRGAVTVPAFVHHQIGRMQADAEKIRDVSDFRRETGKYKPVEAGSMPQHSEFDIRRAVRVLSMVGELHKRGYQRLRVMPYMAPSGLAWRCTIAAAYLSYRNHGAILNEIGAFDDGNQASTDIARYTSGQRQPLFRLG